MASRLCPECDLRTDAEICPSCGIRTLRELRTEAAFDPLLGRVLDERYRIDALIGRGGMGSVYRGVQLATKQVVAIKVIRSEHAENVEAAKRFHREARAASLLSHPHTIRVFDFGQASNGDLYMVLEHLQGRTLASLLRDEGVQRESRATKIALEISQSLAEAHAAGLIHRDLKPDNVMLVSVVGDPDFVKVLDFGVAKFLAGSTGESSVTRTGMVVGTPHYMAPEQAQAGGVTQASDVYALGVMLWELVTGEKPFDGDSPITILMAHAQKPVPDLPVGCRASPPLRALMTRMLAKDRTQRPTAAELVRAFERLRAAAFLAEGDERTPTPASPQVPARAPSVANAAQVTLVPAPNVAADPGAVPASPPAAAPVAAPAASPGSTPTPAALDAAPGRGSAAGEPPLSPEEKAEFSSVALVPPPAQVPDEPAPSAPTLGLPEPEGPTSFDAGAAAVAPSVPTPAAMHAVGRRRGGAFPWIAGAVAILAAVVAWLAWPSDEAPSPASPGVLAAASTPAVAPAPVPVPAAPGDKAPVAVPAPGPSGTAGKEPAAVPAAAPSGPADNAPVAAREFKVRFESTPPGARVLDGDRILGTTPFEGDLDGEPGARRFTFRLPGYRDSVVNRDVASGDTVSTRLDRRVAAPVPVPRPREEERFRPID